MSATRGATVFDVQRFSIHDGPGIRTVVFFKGCGMACAWCQNPEGIGAAVEIAYYADRCLPGCDACVDACPERAIRSDRDARIDFARCNACDICADVCPADAIRVVGSHLGAAEIVSEVLKDHTFFAMSGGGVTLSGGEPVLQSAFLLNLLPMLRAERVHVALETAGWYPPRLLEPLLPLLDLILFDVKVANADAHLRLTGRSSDLVLRNLSSLIRCGAPVQVRVPIVPGFNTDEASIAEMVDVLGRVGVREVSLQRYNHLWEAKLPRLSTPQKPLRIRPPEESFYGDVAAAFSRHGMAVCMDREPRG